MQVYLSDYGLWMDGCLYACMYVCMFHTGSFRRVQKAFPAAFSTLQEALFMGMSSRYSRYVEYAREIT